MVASDGVGESHVKEGGNSPQSFSKREGENRTSDILQHAEAHDASLRGIHGDLSEQQLTASADEEHVLGELTMCYPKAPHAELLRFCRARNGSLEEATNMYEAHLQWRDGQGSPSNCLAAYRAIPQNYVRPAGVAKDGSPCFLVQGARYDPKISPETYVLAFTHLIDLYVPATSMAKATVLVDSRPAEGWPNVPAHNMLPFFRELCNILPDNYPERAQRIIIFPMPLIVRGLWGLVSPLLDQVVQDKFCMLGGSSYVGSPCPAELADYVALDQLPSDTHHMFQELKL